MIEKTEETPQDKKESESQLKKIEKAEIEIETNLENGQVLNFFLLYIDVNVTRISLRETKANLRRSMKLSKMPSLRRSEVKTKQRKKSTKTKRKMTPMKIPRKSEVNRQRKKLVVAILTLK